VNGVRLKPAPETTVTANIRSEARTHVTKHGTVATMGVRNIGASAGLGKVVQVVRPDCPTTSNGVWGIRACTRNARFKWAKLAPPGQPDELSVALDSDLSLPI
jgi:hypothetical protein